MISRSIRRHIAQAMLGAMLFAQAALAVAACDWLRASPAQALAAKAGEPSCHEVPARNANLCLAHCTSTDQSADTPQVAIPVLSNSVPPRMARVEFLPAPEAFQHYTLHRPGAPPLRVLYHSFLI